MYPSETKPKKPVSDQAPPLQRRNASEDGRRTEAQMGDGEDGHVLRGTPEAEDVCGGAQGEYSIAAPRRMEPLKNLAHPDSLRSVIPQEDGAVSEVLPGPAPPSRRLRAVVGPQAVPRRDCASRRSSSRSWGV